MVIPKEKYLEVVGTTHSKEERNSQKGSEADHHFFFMTKEMVDMKKVIKQVLKQKKLVSTDKQPRRKIPLFKDIMGRSLYEKFRLP